MVYLTFQLSISDLVLFLDPLIVYLLDPLLEYVLLKGRFISSFNCFSPLLTK